MGYLEVFPNVGTNSRHLIGIYFQFNFVVVTEPALYDLNIFKFIETPYMVLHMVYLAKCPACTWKEYVSWCWVAVWPVNVGQLQLVASLKSVYLYWYSFYFIDYQERSGRSSKYNDGFVHFSFQFCQFFASYTHRSSVLRCLHIYECYTFLEFAHSSLWDGPPYTR